MSVKIYYGKRCRLGKLEATLKRYRELYIKMVISITKKAMKCVDEEKRNGWLQETWPTWQKIRRSVSRAGYKKGDLIYSNYDQFAKEQGPVFDFFSVWALFIDSSRTQIRWGNVDCWVNAYIRGNFVYFTPESPLGKYKLDDDPAWVEDYAYWTNADKPKGISLQKWNARGDIWKSIIDSHNSGRLFYDIIDAKMSYMCSGVSEVEKKVLGCEESMAMFKATEIADKIAAEREKSVAAERGKSAKENLDSISKP